MFSHPEEHTPARCPLCGLDLKFIEPKINTTKEKN